ncbi:MAG TPA: response regulator [Kofleriaceae bacterium]|nr:response regulator [Kofleriaceae bacterium]
MSTRVLVVDDDTLVCRAISVVLARGGFDVRSAHDGGPALEIVSAWTPDIAVVDYNMPTSGLSLVRQLKSRLGDHVFVAVLTGDDCEEMREKSLAGGADAVLIKPIAPVELRRRLMAAATALKMLDAAS